MIRLGMVLAAVVLMSATDRVAHARMAIQTFAVLAGRRSTRRLSRAGRHSLVHRAIRGQTRPARSQDGKSDLIPRLHPVRLLGQPPQGPARRRQATARSAPPAGRVPEPATSAELELTRHVVGCLQLDPGGADHAPPGR